MQRVKELDSLRGLAAIAIVLYHLWFIKIGLLGAAVDLFFVLSGYLITSILLSHPPTRGFLVAFYMRRGLRIWPIYYLTLLVVVLINAWALLPGTLDGLPYHFGFLQNLTYYWSNRTPSFIPAFVHTWSLAVEEQFYLLWPALLCVVGRRGLRWSALGLIVVAVMMRGLDFNRWILATHCDGLALGAILAGLLESPADAPARRDQRAVFLAVGLASVAFWVGSAVVLRFAAPDQRGHLFVVVQSTRMLSLNLVFFSMVGLVVHYAGAPWLAVLRDPRLIYLGQISYGLYLYHHIVFYLWEDYSKRHGLGHHLIVDLAMAGLSLAIAALSYRYIERPILSLKDLFPYQTVAPREVKLNYG
jgi:peptidoglycan/LPS O-acetylase OafA/YrhL